MSLTQGFLYGATHGYVSASKTAPFHLRPLTTPLTPLFMFGPWCRPSSRPGGRPSSKAPATRRPPPPDHTASGQPRPPKVHPAPTSSARAAASPGARSVTRACAPLAASSSHTSSWWQPQPANTTPGPTPSSQAARLRAGVPGWRSRPMPGACTRGRGPSLMQPLQGPALLAGHHPPSPQPSPSARLWSTHPPHPTPPTPP